MGGTQGSSGTFLDLDNLRSVLVCERQGKPEWAVAAVEASACSPPTCSLFLCSCHQMSRPVSITLSPLPPATLFTTTTPGLLSLAAIFSRSHLCLPRIKLSYELWACQLQESCQDFSLIWPFPPEGGLWSAIMRRLGLAGCRSCWQSFFFF